MNEATACLRYRHDSGGRIGDYCSQGRQEYESLRGYAVLYVLDGNPYFATATDTLTRQSGNKIVAPAIVVGLGYPTDDPEEVTRLRMFDLTPSVSKTPQAPGVKTGGGDTFLRVIEEEVKPF